MSDQFYRAFEDKFRGPRELIKDRLTVYLDFVLPLLQVSGQSKAVDLGCGRGEWLEFLQEIGFEVEGVDLDEHMLQACRELHLSVLEKDALEFLKQLPEASRSIISGFHIAEHLPFDVLFSVISEAFRVLTPGGLLILETPNPENILVGSHRFYLDPTHQRPIPPELLAFIPEYVGFERTKILRLQQDSILERKLSPSLIEVLGGASPDYAVISQKGGGVQQLQEVLAGVFDRNFGLTLENLSARFDGQIDNIAYTAKLAGDKAQQAQDKALQVEDSAHKIQIKVQQLESDFAHMLAHASDLESRLRVVIQSRSWRITAPMRWIGTQARRLRDQGLKARLKALIKKICRKLNSKLRSYPLLRERLIFMSRKLGCYALIKKLLRNDISAHNGPNVPKSNMGETQSLNQLTKRGCQIHADLLVAMKRFQKGND